MEEARARPPSAVGQALIANQGYQAPAAARFERAMVLADEIGDVSLQLPAAYGKWVAPYIVGTGSGELAQRYAALAETQPETGPRLVGLRMLGLERFHEGCFKESLALMTTACDGYDPIAHRDLAFRFGHDPRAASANYQAWNLWHLGFPDQAARKIEDSLRWTREVNHANTTGLVLCYGVNILTCGCVGPTGSKALRARPAPCRRPLDGPLARLCADPSRLGPIAAGRGAGSRRDRGWPARGAPAGCRPARAFHLGSPPKPMPAPAGMRKRGRASARRSQLSLMAATWLSPPSFIACARCCRVAAVQARPAAEADLRGALNIARQQEAPSLELRAARDLASMLAERGERQQAADLLAPAYGRFTEGFATADLEEAKALLDELGRL